MTGTDLNISFQDTQYLSELYAKLGSLQYDLANFDMIELERRLVVFFLVGILGLFLGMVLSAVVDYFCEKYDVKHPGNMLLAYLVVWVAVVIVACILISNVVISFAERDILREIEATEMAIEAIKMKYGMI